MEMEGETWRWMESAPWSIRKGQAQHKKKSPLRIKDSTKKGRVLYKGARPTCAVEHKKKRGSTRKGQISKKTPMA